MFVSQLIESMIRAGTGDAVLKQNLPSVNARWRSGLYYKRLLYFMVKVSKNG